MIMYMLWIINAAGMDEIYSIYDDVDDDDDDDDDACLDIHDYDDDIVDVTDDDTEDDTNDDTDDDTDDGGCRNLYTIKCSRLLFF